jgi:hypothetical protein
MYVSIIMLKKWGNKLPEVFYHYSVSRHYPSSCFLFKTTYQRLGSVSIVRWKHTQLGQIDRASPYLQTTVPKSKSKSKFLQPDFITVRQLQVCWCVALSLTRGWVCCLHCCWPSPAQSFSDLSTVELMTIFYSLRFKTPNLGVQVSIFIYPRNRVAQLYPQALGPLFVASYSSNNSTNTT